MHLLSATLLLFATSACDGEHRESERNLSLEIVPYPDEESSQYVRLQFRNKGTEPVQFLKPLGNTSIYGYHQPHYNFTIIDSRGNALKLLPGGCGSAFFWTAKNWPDQYLVKVGAGEFFEMEVYLPFAIAKAGRHSIAFEYVYQPISKEQIRRAPKGVWTGRVRAKQVRAHLQEAVSARIKRDAELSEHAELDSLSYIDASFSELTDEGLKQISMLPRLRSLNLRGTKITDDAMTVIATIPNLRKLDLSDTNIGDRGIAVVRNLRYLADHNLDSTKISNSALRLLSSSTSLRRLRLYNTRIDDDGIVHLARLKSLESLSIARTAASDSSAIHVGALPRLKTLFIYKTKITDKGLDVLVHLDDLVHLSVGKRPIQR